MIIGGCLHHMHAGYLLPDQVYNRCDRSDLAAMGPAPGIVIRDVSAPCTISNTMHHMVLF